MQEVWKDIIGYEGYYQVSNLGRIKRVVSKNCPKERLRKIQYKRNGYAVVMLTVNQKYKLLHVHRLVALLFVPNPENKPQVNHLDLDKTNNKSLNLEWTTGLENMRHALSNKKWSNNSKRGKDNPRSRPVIQFDKNGNYIKDWVSITEASAHLKIGRGEIGCVCSSDQRKTAGGFKWEYKTL